MAESKKCKTCIAEGVETKRPAPHPGPRCSTHHREVLAARKAAAHEKRIVETYGVTAEEYQAIYELQGGKCAICQRATGAKKKLSIDHDHDTGFSRGLLCLPCNRNVLGHARDDIEFFERAIEYLKNPPAQQVIGERVAPVHGTDAEKSTPRKRYPKKRRRKK